MSYPVQNEILFEFKVERPKITHFRGLRLGKGGYCLDKRHHGATRFSPRLSCQTEEQLNIAKLKIESYAETLAHLKSESK